MLPVIFTGLLRLVVTLTFAHSIAWHLEGDLVIDYNHFLPQGAHH